MRLYRAILRNQLLLFALPTAIGLTLLGRWDAFPTLPIEFWTSALRIGAFDPGAGIDKAVAVEFALVPLIGVVLGVALALRRQRRGRRPPQSKRFGDFSVLVPLNRRDLVMAGGVSLAAGVCEELFFRLLLPLLLAAFVGGEIAFILSLLMFGLVHIYQGWKGVVATAFVGLLLTWIYLLSGSLLVAIWVHVVIDLNGLVIRPALRGFDKPAAD